MKTQRTALAALGALLLTTSGCGLIKVNINDGTSPQNGGGTGQGQAGSEAGEAETAFKGKDANTVTVKLDKGFGPNPRLARMTVKATMSPKKAGFECGFGDEVSSAPNALVTVGPGAEKLEIRARTNVAGILLSKDGKFFCATDDDLRSMDDRVSLRPNGLTAGTYEVRVLLSSTQGKKFVAGKGYEPQPVDVVLSFSDPSRGEVYDGSVKKVTLDAAPTEPMFIVGKTHKGEAFRRGDRRCKGSYTAMPFAVYSTDRPLGAISFRELWAPQPVELRMQELPKGDEPAKSEGWCSDDEPARVGLQNLDGRVAIHIGTVGDDASPRPFGYVVLSPDTVVDPFALSPLTLPSKVNLPERQLVNHFPFIREFINKGRNVSVAMKFSVTPSQAGSETDKLRQRLFLEAPKPLFVAPKYDLDKNSTSSQDGDFPKQGEALLLYEWGQNRKHVTVFRADGSAWEVLTTALVDPGSLAVPSTTSRTFDEKHAWSNSGPEDAALRDKVTEADKKYEACFQKATAAADAQIDAINNTNLHWTRAAKAQKDRIWDTAAAAAERSCGKAKLKALREQTDKDLVAARKARIEQRLAAIAERLGKL